MSLIAWRHLSIPALVAVLGAAGVVDCLIAGEPGPQGHGRICFVSGLPHGHISPVQPVPTEILVLGGSGELQRHWRLDTVANSILVYEDGGTIMIGEGSPRHEKIHLFSTSIQDAPRVIDLTGARAVSSMEFVLNVNLVRGGNGPPVVAVTFGTTDASSTVYVDSDTSIGVTSLPTSPSRTPPAFWVTGCYYSQDLISAGIGSDGRLEVPRGPQVGLPDQKIPKPLIPVGARRGWNIAASTSEFAALQQVPVAVSQPEMNVLLYDRQEGTWQAVQLPGAASFLRLVGDQLVAKEGHLDPRTDFENHLGFDPIWGDRHFVVDPRTGAVHTVPLGASAEIVYLGPDDTVVYRRDDQLLQRHLRSKGGRDRLLAKAPIVEHVHWAFGCDPGSE